MTPDVNVLVASFRSDHVFHVTARTWLEQARQDCARGLETLTLLPVVLAGFLRIVTNPRVFSDPDPVEDGVDFIDVILGTPGAALRASEDEWPLLRSKLLAGSLRGNLITDAWIAAAVEVLSEHLVTFDGGFVQLLPARDMTLLR